MSPRDALGARLVACAAAAGVVGAAACWDFESLSNGKADGGFDAPVATPDTGTPGDTGSAGDVGAAGDAGFCASLHPQPLFCEDFDRGPLPGQFTDQFNMNGTERLDPTSFVSRPDSLLAQYMALPANQPLDVVLRKEFTLTGLPSTLTFELFLQPVKADATANTHAVVASLDYFDNANDRYDLQFSELVNAGQVNLRFEEQSQPVNMGIAQTNYALAAALPMGAWTDVRLVVTGGRAQITYGGVLQADVTLTNPVTPTRLRLSLGATFESTPSQGWEMRYDNVTLDATP